MYRAECLGGRVETESRWEVRATAQDRQRVAWPRRGQQKW